MSFLSNIKELSILLVKEANERISSNQEDDLSLKVNENSEEALLNEITVESEESLLNEFREEETEKPVEIIIQPHDSQDLD